MLYSTYLGGNSSTARDDVYGMTMDPTGRIVATGRTQSADFPMTAGGPTIFNSAPISRRALDEPYVVKINPTLNGTASLVYSTFLGGDASGSGRLLHQPGRRCAGSGLCGRGDYCPGGAICSFQPDVAPDLSIHPKRPVQGAPG